MFFQQGQFNIKQSWNESEQPNSNSGTDKSKVAEKKKNSNDLTDLLDNDTAKRIMKDFYQEGGFKSRFFNYQVDFL